MKGGLRGRLLRGSMSGTIPGRREEARVTTPLTRAGTNSEEESTDVSVSGNEGDIESEDSGSEPDNKEKKAPYLWP